MSFRHLGGPRHGDIADTCDPAYSPVVMSFPEEGGAHPQYTQDAVWNGATIVKARFRLDGELHEAELGHGMRTIEARDGKPVTSKQKVLRIAPSGWIIVEAGTEWGDPSESPITTIEVTNLQDIVVE